MGKLLAVLSVLALVGAGELEAQRLPIAIEARGGFALPTGEWNDDEGVDNGVGFGANLQFTVTPLFGVYAGWERFAFGADGDLDGADAEFVDAGGRAGLHLMLPLEGLPVAPFARGGIYYGSTVLEIDGAGASLDLESDSSLGFEVEGGVELPLGMVVSLVPSVLFRTHEAEFDALDGSGVDPEQTVSYVVLGAGLKLRF